MMKQSLYPLFALALMILAGACEKEIAFKGEVTEPRLTLAARAVVGEPFDVYVASSIFFLESENAGAAFKKGLDTARGTVRCYVNGEKDGIEMALDSALSVAGFCYRAAYVPAPGDHIRLEAEFPGFDKVWSEVDVPRLPRFELLARESRKMENDWGADSDYYEIDLTLAVTDDGSYDKYYFIQPLASYQRSWPWGGYVGGEGTGDPDEPEDVFSSLIFTSNDIIFTSSRNVLGSDSGTSFGSSYFSDALIKGKRHEFKITLLYVPAPELVSRLGLKLATAEENLYWYDYSYSQLEMSFGGLFAEAVTLYSNVNGGYGILSAAAPLWLEVEW